MRSLRERWLYAAKPDSWGKLLVPFALGQAMGLGPALDAGHGPSVTAFVLGLAFTVLDLLFIVFLNDWGDREVDAIKRRMFPEGCSPKTIPDEILPARALLLAGLGCGVLAIVVAILASVVLDRPLFVPAALGALGIFVAYTLPPLRLNYRGGGELCEMIGVGAVLPWLNAYLQGGRALPESLWVLPGFATLALASAIASGLADERSDRAGGKHTVVTTIGNTLSRRAIEGLVIVGALLWLATALVGLPLWLGGGAAVAVVWSATDLRRASAAAQTDAFGPQRLYKAHLHAAITRGAASIGVGLVVFELL